jgi:Trk-type K+ transport system membrane component
VHAFSVFSIFFEVVSAYGNVGLSLGHPSNSTSLSGHFTVFSKVVICAMMIRGRHRGLPYALDRAITLPSDHDDDMEINGEDTKLRKGLGKEKCEMKGRKMLKSYTQ